LILLIDNPNMKLTLRQIQVFAAVAQTENVSRAAGQLAMSQSAASSALVELERQFDCPLFDRIGKSLRLNATGRGLLPLAEDLLGRAAEIESVLSGGQLGPLSVGATMSIGNYLATLIVADYLQQHPASQIDLKVANTRHILDGVLHCEIDIGLIEGESSDPDLLLEPWLTDELVVFCAPQHPLAASGRATTEQLRREHWVLREAGSGTRALFDQVVAPALGRPLVRLQLEHTEAIKRAVEAGLGLACLSRLTLDEAFRRGNLVELRTEQFDLQRNFHFVRHRQRHLSPASRAFMALCRSIGDGVQASHTLAPRT
jgi:DNA-binding transcriptional LysR family regulator